MGLLWEIIWIKAKWKNKKGKIIEGRYRYLGPRTNKFIVEYGGKRIMCYGDSPEWGDYKLVEDSNER